MSRNSICHFISGGALGIGLYTTYLSKPCLVALVDNSRRGSKLCCFTTRTWCRYLLQVQSCSTYIQFVFIRYNNCCDVILSLGNNQKRVYPVPFGVKNGHSLRRYFLFLGLFLLFKFFTTSFIPFYSTIMRTWGRSPQIDTYKTCAYHYDCCTVSLLRVKGIKQVHTETK